MRESLLMNRNAASYHGGRVSIFWKVLSQEREQLVMKTSQYQTLYPEFTTVEELDAYLSDYADLLDLLDKENRSLFSALQKGEKFREKFSIVPGDALFSKLIHSFLGCYFEVVCEAVENLSIPKEAENLINSCIPRFYHRVFEIIYRVGILEVNTLSSGGDLGNGTEEEKYRVYEELCSTPEYLQELNDRYPALHPMIDRSLSNVTRYFVNLLENLENKYHDISSMYAQPGGEIGALLSIDLGQGDSHCGGKTVAIIEFENAKVVYKPRSMKTELGMNELYRFCNEIARKELFKQIKTTDYGDFGVMEYVENIPCKTESELSHYYYNLGALLCLMYCTNTNDCHFENIIANGNNPCIVDFETVFHPGVDWEIVGDASPAGVISFLNTSVSSIGLLPNKILVAGKVFSLSGIPSQDEQVSPIKAYELQNVKRSDICVKYGYQAFDATAGNNPGCLFPEKSPCEYQEEICAGFEFLYFLIASNRDAFIKIVEEVFKDVDLRIISKPTMMYSSLLGIVSHPDVLRDRWAHLALLARIGVNGENKTLGRSEVMSMLYQDVPYFKTKFYSRDIYDSKNCLVMTNGKTPREFFLHKMGCLSNLDFERQVEMIKDSFYRFDPKCNPTNFNWNDKNTCVPETSEWVDTGLRIIDFLLEKRSFVAMNNRGTSDRFFIGSNVVNMDKDDWKKGLNDMDIYDGNSGFALLMLRAYEITRNHKYLEIAWECLNPIMAGAFKTDLTGYHKGRAGQIFALSQCCRHSQNDYAREALTRLLEDCESLLSSNSIVDYIGGNAGLGNTLCMLLNDSTDEGFQLKAKSLLKDIGAMAVRLFSAEENYSQVFDYSGFAHGVASNLVLTYRLYLTFGDELYLNLFYKLLHYERSAYYSKDTKLWLDGPSKREGTSCGWCHGSPGVLLGRLLLKNMGYVDQRIDGEIDTLVEDIKRRCFGHTLTYCHGDLGNMEILKYASAVLSDKALQEKCFSNYQTLYEASIKQILDCNYANPAKKLNGLMMGLSGVSYSLLSMAAGDKSLGFLAL